MPSASYIECPQHGPIHSEEVEWVEIKTVEVQRTGKRIPDLKIDRSEDITNALSRINGAFARNRDAIRILSSN